MNKANARAGNTVHKGGPGRDQVLSLEVDR